MPKGIKLTLEEVRSFCKGKDLTLIGGYVNADTPITVACPNDHRWDVTLHSLLVTSGKCYECLGKQRPKPLTMEDVLEVCKKAEVRLVSEYVKAKDPVTVACHKDHEWVTSIHAIKKNGAYCPECNKNNTQVMHEPHTIEYVRSVIEGRGCTLLSTEYKNTITPLLIRCSKPVDPHEVWMPFKTFARGAGCKQCFYEDPSLTGVVLTREMLIKKMRWRVLNEARKINPKLKGITFDGNKEFFNNLADQILSVLGNRPTPLHELDHVIACSRFDHTDLEQIKLCWNIQNFAWIVRSENREKNRFISEDLFSQLTPYQLNALAKSQRYQDRMTNKARAAIVVQLQPNPKREQVKVKPMFVQLDLFAS